MDLNREQLIYFCDSEYKSTGRYPDLYIPVTIGNDILLDRGPRYYKNQYESRLKYLDITGKNVLDIGSNTGFISNWCASNGAAHVTGIEIKPEMTIICEQTSKLANIKNISYQCIDKYEFAKGVTEQYDVALQLSNFDYSTTIRELGEYGNIAKVWYIEPTNRPCGGINKGYDTEWIINWANTELTRFGDVEFLTTTDYQDRGLVKLTMK